MWKKIGGLIAMLASFYLLSEGWATTPYSPFFHALTVASATCFMFPIVMWDVIIGSLSDSNGKLPFSAWAFLSTFLFGNIVIFHVDSIAEERLHMVFSSPRHLMVAGACIIVMEIVFNMEISLTGFMVCCLILGFGDMDAFTIHLHTDQRLHHALNSPEEGVFRETVKFVVGPQLSRAAYDNLVTRMVTDNIFRGRMDAVRNLRPIRDEEPVPMVKI